MSSIDSASAAHYIATANEYGVTDYDKMFAYPFLANGLLMEPYRETTFSFIQSVSGCTYDWNLEGMNNDYSSSGSSAEGEFVATAYIPGRYELNIKETCVDGTTGELMTYVWVKYVRRELSNLNENDKEEFLDSFRTLWDVNTVDGQALYGDRYRSLYFFASLHNDGGGNSICDAFHGGVGFVNNHMFLSAYLEQSLQLINPKVALNYLEYTKLFTSTDFSLRKLTINKLINCK
jgi:hypothetical protein